VKSAASFGSTTSSVLLNQFLEEYKSALTYLKHRRLASIKNSGLKNPKFDRDKMTDSFSICATIISEYDQKSQSMIIEAIMYARDRLAAQSYFLAEEASRFKNEYNEKYFISKVAVLGRTQKLIEIGTKIGAARTMAEVENEGVIKERMEAGGRAYRADLLLKQVNQVLSAMQQRISFLKLQYDKIITKYDVNPNTGETK